MVVEPSLIAVGPVGKVVVVTPCTAVKVAATAVPSGCDDVAELPITSSPLPQPWSLVTVVAPKLGVAFPSKSFFFKYRMKFSLLPKHVRVCKFTEKKSSRTFLSAKTQNNFSAHFGCGLLM